MCDRCGAIFSEKREGWQTFSVSRQSRNQHGMLQTTSEDYDACPECAFSGVVQPVVKEIPPQEVVEFLPEDRVSKYPEKLRANSQYGKNAE